MFDALPSTEWFTNVLYSIINACSSFFDFVNTPIGGFNDWLPDFGDSVIADLFETWVDFITGGIFDVLFPDITILEMFIGSFVLYAVYQLAIWVLNLVT